MYPLVNLIKLTSVLVQLQISKAASEDPYNRHALKGNENSITEFPSISHPIPTGLPPGFIPGNGGGGGSGGSGGGNGSHNGGNSPHPLDPLTEEEIRTTSDVINSYKTDDTWIFSSITLTEPPKSELLPYFLNDSTPAPNTISRKSLTVLVDLEEMKIYEITVNLNTKEMQSWNEAPEGARPLITDEVAMILGEKIVKQDPEVQERCRKLGWTNMSLVSAEPWPMGYVGDKPELEGKWVYPLYLFGKHFEWDNQNAHPFDFLVIADLVKRQVVSIYDLPTHDGFDTSNKEGNTVPQKEINFDQGLKDPNSFRKDLKPVKASQNGTSFTMNGYELKWQKFKMRIGFNYREGLVIYKVHYNDSGVLRPLLYRMSVAEMFIAYGDPRPPYHWKYVFDEGQYGLGFSANSLRAGEDCIGEVRFIDGVVNDAKGESVRIPGAICIREEDAGSLWKHTEFRTGRSNVVRSQRLAMTFIATVGNYDYIFTWNFYLDGKIEFNVKLTGIPSVNMMAVGATPGGHGTTMSPQINAIHHQHFFSLRVDPEIDGNKNTVSVSEVVPGPGETGSATNPYGNGFTTEKTILQTASEGRANTDSLKSRSWLISNPANIHPYTKTPVSWKLKPFVSPPVMMRHDSPLISQARWTDYNTWVTPYQEGQFYPGGAYLNNSGLPEWVSQNPDANIENTDVVLWHNFGITHIVRAEDWPVMPEESCSVFLKPYNFFNENPSVDVPAPSRRALRTEL